MDGMNMKRQRRPNVRLGEIGNVSAASLCGTSQPSVANWEETRWKSKSGTLKELVSSMQFRMERDFVKSEIPSWGNRSLMHDEGQVDAEIMQEDVNGFDNGVGEAKIISLIDKKPGLELGPVVKKVRHTKVRHRGPREGRISSSESWKNAEGGSDITNVEKCHGVDVQTDHAAKHVSYDGETERIKDSGHEILGSPPYEKDQSDLSKDPSPDAVVVNFEQLLSPRINDELVDHQEEQVQVDSVDYRIPCDGTRNDGVSDDDGNCLGQGDGGSSKLKGDAERKDRGTEPNEKKFMPFTSRVIGTVISVKEWLEGLGFGKCAHTFEIHEVDNEVLPLLTFEDLKEMGINAVGLRRKLYTAIQMLRNEMSAHNQEIRMCVRRVSLQVCSCDYKGRKVFIC